MNKEQKIALLKAAYTEIGVKNPGLLAKHFVVKFNAAIREEQELDAALALHECNC